MLTKANAVATAILAILVSKMNESEHVTMNTEPYFNGRENGYAISFFGISNKKFVFSENRNSDEIVLYIGKDCTCFSMQGNVPNEETYKEKMFFRYDEHVKTAEFILATIR